MTRTLARSAALLLLASCGVALAGVAQADAAACRARSGATVPIVVELYTSEGCDACPPADRWLSSLAGRPDVVRLAFHVDYWDRLGWKDRFADPAYTRRQHEVMRPSGARFVYTPQVIVDGADYRGWPALPPGRARAATLGIDLTRDGDTYSARLERGPGTPPRLAAYWAVTEDGHVSEVQAGENRGATLHHDAVVRDYLLLPAVGDAPLRFTPRAPADGARPRHVLLVVTDADSGKPVQAAGC